MKKVLSIMLAAVMIVGFVTGCSAKSSETTAKDSAAEAATTVAAAAAEASEKSGDPEPFTIGFPWATASTDPTFVSIVNNVRAAVESAGGELVLVESDLTADTLINNISELISRGVDGIIFMDRIWGWGLTRITRMPSLQNRLERRAES